MNECKGGSNIKAINNKIEQERLKLNVTGFGIPASYHEKTDEIIDSLNRTLALSLDKHSFKSIYTTNPRKQPQCTLKMKFHDMLSKTKFMKAVEKYSLDVNKKWQPITVEDIFEEFKQQSNPLCGKQVLFLNMLTPTGQEIMKLKKRIGSCILRERDGIITIKKDARSAPVEVNSVEEVHQYVAQHS